MLEKSEGSEFAAAYAGNCTIGAKYDFAKQRIKLKNLDIEVAITISSSIGR